NLIPVVICAVMSSTCAMCSRECRHNLMPGRITTRPPVPLRSPRCARWVWSPAPRGANVPTVDGCAPHRAATFVWEISMEHQPIEPDVPDAPTPGQPDDPPHPPLDAPPEKPPVVRAPHTAIQTVSPKRPGRHTALHSGVFA